jgi:hypothetical protein
LTPAHTTSLDSLPDHLPQNRSIEREDLELTPIVGDSGGRGAIRRVLGGTKLDALIRDMSGVIAP